MFIFLLLPPYWSYFIPYNDHTGEGGVYVPTHCQPTSRLAILIPYRLGIKVVVNARSIQNIFFPGIFHFWGAHTPFNPPSIALPPYLQLWWLPVVYRKQGMNLIAAIFSSCSRLCTEPVFRKQLYTVLRNKNVVYMSLGWKFHVKIMNFWGKYKI